MVGGGDLPVALNGSCRHALREARPSRGQAASPECPVPRGTTTPQSDQAPELPLPRPQLQFFLILCWESAQRAFLHPRIFQNRGGDPTTTELELKARESCIH